MTVHVERQHTTVTQFKHDNDMMVLMAMITMKMFLYEFMKRGARRKNTMISVLFTIDI